MEIYFTSALAAIIAVWGILSQRVITKRKATIDFFAKLENDSDYIDAKKAFVEIVNNKTLIDYAKPGKGSAPEARHIQTVLNNYELISIGVQRGSLDFKIVERFAKSTILYHWKNSESFIIELRNLTGRKTIFTEFEQLANWLSNNKKPKRGKFWSNIF